MRSFKSGVLGFATAAFFGTLVVVGCGADGTTGDVDPTQGVGNTEPPEESSSGTPLPPSSSSGDDPEPTGDAGKPDASKDAGKDAKADTGVDAGPPPPAEGEACTTPNQIFKRACGTCGTQEAVCLAPDNKVSAYGQCTNEVAGGCVAGTVETVACGNCGTQTRTCSKYCSWTNSACTGQPAQSCTPGAVELLSAGCGADLYRQHTCEATCAWGNISATCTAPPTFVNVPPTVGSTNGTIAVFSATKTTPRLPSYGACPLTGTISTTATQYAYIEVKNTNAKAVTVSIFNSQATGGQVIDTIMAAYPGNTIPTTDAARKACVGGVGDYGDDALVIDSEFASIDPTQTYAKPVPIPANSSVMVYFASYGASTTNQGMMNLKVKLETIAP